MKDILFAQYIEIYSLKISFRALFLVSGNCRPKYQFWINKYYFIDTFFYSYSNNV